MNNVDTFRLQLKDDPSFGEKFMETIDGVISIEKEDGRGFYIIKLNVDKRDRDSFLDVLRDAGINYHLEDLIQQDNK